MALNKTFGEVKLSMGDAIEVATFDRKEIQSDMDNLKS